MRWKTCARVIHNHCTLIWMERCVPRPRSSSRSTLSYRSVGEKSMERRKKEGHGIRSLPFHFHVGLKTMRCQTRDVTAGQTTSSGRRTCSWQPTWEHGKLPGSRDWVLNTSGMTLKWDAVTLERVGTDMAAPWRSMLAPRLRHQWRRVGHDWEHVVGGDLSRWLKGESWIDLFVEASYRSDLQRLDSVQNIIWQTSWGGARRR